ncbi:MAG: hypothetical protein U5K71_15075 [Gracilimonas sp.]|nr:hypothetical protein [Gracilimonas sp.]
MERSEQLSELLAGLQELKKNSGNFVATSQNGSTQKEPETKTEEEPGKVTEPDVETPTPVTDSAPEEQEASGSEEEIEIEAEEADPEPAEPEMEVEAEEEEEDDFDIGAPALMTSLSHKTQTKAQPKAENRNGTGTSSNESSTEKETPEKITTEYVQEIWVEYLESLKGDFPMLLHLQMERAKVKKVKGGELHLECDNDFAQKMLDEQSTDLQFKLKEFTGSVLRFNISVGEKDEKDKPMSVYERFKQIQQKDPIIRDIVEIFGAELEY